MKMQNLILGTLGTALLTAAASGCTAMPFEPYSIKDIENPIYKTKIEISDENRPIFYKLSEKEGIEQILDVSKKSDKEDAWIDRKRNIEEFFIDVGRTQYVNKTDKGTSNGVYICRTDIKNLVKKGDIIALYHNHPTFDKIKYPNREIYNPFTSSSDWGTLRWIKDIAKEIGFEVKCGVSVNECVICVYDILPENQKKQNIIEIETEYLMRLHILTMSQKQPPFSLADQIDLLEKAMLRCGYYLKVYMNYEAVERVFGETKK